MDSTSCSSGRCRRGRGKSNSNATIKRVIHNNPKYKSGRGVVIARIRIALAFAIIAVVVAVLVVVMVMVTSEVATEVVVV